MEVLTKFRDTCIKWGCERGHATTIKTNSFIPGIAAPIQPLANFNVFRGQSFDIFTKLVAGKVNSKVDGHSEGYARI